MNLKEYFSLKNLAVLMSIAIILPAFDATIHSPYLFIIACFATFFGIKIKEQESIKFTLLACGIWALSVFLFNLFPTVFDFLIPILLTLCIIIYGIFKCKYKIDKLNLTVGAVLLTFRWIRLYFLYSNLVCEVINFSIPFILFLALFIAFLSLSSKETTDDKTKKSCYLAIVGAIINFIPFILYIVFAITLPDDHSGVFGFIPSGKYPFYDFCDRTMEYNVLWFVLAGIAMCSYHYYLGKRSKWNLSRICINGIVGLFGFGVIVAFVAGNISEYVVSLRVQDILPIIYYITAACILYSNINFVKIL